MLTIKVALDKFARSGIEAQMGPDVPGAVRTALFHYAYKLKAGRKPIGIPQFLRDRGPAEPRAAFDLVVDGEAATLLELEAARQGTTLAELINHSVLVYLAELDFLTGSPRSGPGSSFTYV